MEGEEQVKGAGWVKEKAGAVEMEKAKVGEAELVMEVVTGT